MIVELNPNVQKVLEFMQKEIPSDELNGVAASLPIVARAIWGHFPVINVQAARLIAEPITHDSQ